MKRSIMLIALMFIVGCGDKDTAQKEMQYTRPDEIRATETKGSADSRSIAGLTDAHGDLASAAKASDQEASGAIRERSRESGIETKSGYRGERRAAGYAARSRSGVYRRTSHEQNGSVRFNSNPRGVNDREDIRIRVRTNDNP